MRGVPRPGVFDTLKERGFVSQCSNEEGLRKLLDTERVTFYIGFDPTAKSLQIGNLMQLMYMSHLQKAGHRPIMLIGGGTTRIGDPSGQVGDAQDPPRGDHRGRTRPSSNGRSRASSTSARARRSCSTTRSGWRR